MCLLHEGLWREPEPDWKSHKYTRGALSLYSGSMAGAAILAARAAQKTGCGIIRIAAPPAAHSLHIGANPDTVCINAKNWAKIVGEARSKALLIGPGCAPSRKMRKLVSAALASGKACILDAGALTSFAETPQTLFRQLHENTVLTPHYGELAHLIAPQRLKNTQTPELARQLSTETRSVWVLKSACPLIAAPSGKIVFCANAPHALAVAGSGDALSGFIAGYAAQGLDGMAAACAGVSLQIRAAQRCLKTRRNFTASDLVEASNRLD